MYYYRQLQFNFHKMQRTSIFSQFDTISNDSISSKQLQCWLKQISPQPTNAFEWTLMSQNSSQNCPNALNMHYQSNNPYFDTLQQKESLQSRKKQMKEAKEMKETKQIKETKSYVNAMRALQQKTKILQVENQKLKKDLLEYSSERNRGEKNRQTAVIQFKNKINELEVKVTKYEQLLAQHKIIKEQKEQQNAKIKVINKQNGQLNLIVQQLTLQKNNIAKEKEQISAKFKKIQEKYKLNQTTVEELRKKNKVLEDSKEKSQNNLLNKYNSTLQSVSNITAETQRLHQEIEQLKFKQNQLKQNIHIKHCQMQKYRHNCTKSQEQMQQKCILINELKQEILSLKEQNKNINNQFVTLLKNLSLTSTQPQQLQSQIRETIAQISKQQQPMNKINFMPVSLQLQDLPNKKTQQVGELTKRNESKKKPTKSIKKQKPKHKIQLSSLNISQQVAQRNLPQIKQVFQEQQEIKSRYIEDRPHYIDKSTVQSIKDENNTRRMLGQSSCNQQHYPHIKVIKKHRSQQKQNSRSFHGSKSLSKQKSKSKESESMKNTPKNSRSQQRRVLKEQQINTPHASEWGQARRVEPCIAVNHILLRQVQKEALRLYDQQERLLNFSAEDCGHNERSEYLGRLKQLNQQIKINSSKMMQLKSL